MTNQNTNRGAILYELRQLVNEIDNNNYVARKLYDYCDRSGNAGKDDFNKYMKVEMPNDIPNVHPMMTPLVPHYHMSELLTTTFTMVVTFIESIRNLIRTVMNCVVGTPPMRSIAIQYDNIKIAPKPEADNRVNFNNPHSTRIVPPPTIIGKSNMEVALGCNIDCDESTYFMYNPRTRDSNIMTDTTGDSEENLFDFTTNMEVECRSKSKSSLKLSHFSFDEAPPTEEIAVIPVQEKPQKVPAPVAQGVVKVELRSILGGDYEPTRIPPERDPSTIQRSNTTPLALPKIPSHSSGRSIGSKRRTPRVQHKGSTRLVPSKDKSGQFSERRFMNHI